MRKMDENENHHVKGNSQSKKDKYCVFSYLKNLDLKYVSVSVVIKQKRGHRNEKEILGKKNDAAFVIRKQKVGYVEEEGD